MQEKLEELARGWDVTITTATGGNYIVAISRRGHIGDAVHMYSDPRLDRAVARAWAGESPDNARW
jgi:hypothetical protein